MKLLKNQRYLKAIVILALTLFFLVSTSIFFTYTVLNNKLKQQLVDTNMELLRQVDHKLDHTLQYIDKLTIQLLKNDEVIRFFDYEMTEQEIKNNQMRINNLMTNAIQSMDNIFTIDMYSYTKQRLVSGNILSGDALANDLQWISQFEDYGGFYKWISFKRMIANRSEYPIYKNVVSLIRTYPLIHPVGSRKGAIAFNVKEDSLYSLIQKSAEEADDGQTFVIDKEGVVVLHSDKSKLGKDISEFPYIDRILNTSLSGGHFITEAEQASSSVFYIHSSYTDWTMIRVVPQVQLTKPLAVFRNGLIILAAVLFVFVTVSAAFVGRWTLRPMNRFIQSMRGKLIKHEFKKDTDDFHYFEYVVQDILDDREQLHKQVLESKPLIKWRLMTELLAGRGNNQAVMRAYMERLKVSLFEDQFVVMSIEFDNKEQIASPQDLHLYAYALCNVAEELMNAESQGIAAELDNGKCAVIMSFEGEEDRGRHYLRAVATADLMKEFVREYFNRTITIGIGGPVQQLEDIHRSYKQSLEALSYKLVMGGNTIITLEDIVSDPSPQFYKLSAMTDGILASVKMLDAEKVQQQLQRWFEAIAENGVPSEMIMQLVVQCLMKAATVAADIGVDTSGVFPEQSLVEMLNQYERLEQLEQFTVTALQQLVNSIKEKRSYREKNDVIDKVMDYIQENYMRNDLSLNLIASEFHISVSHLSKLFKEQEECNFIDYLIDLRMGHAKRKLSDTEEKIRDIAEQAGYSNVNSFVRIFKKMTGLTPTEYRERNKTQ